jgi:hypothetical protein
MQLKCKICGKMVDTQKSAGGLNFNFATDSEDIFNAAKMGKEILALVNHLMAEHPEEAMKLYANVISSLYSVFEITDSIDPDMTL